MTIRETNEQTLAVWQPPPLEPWKAAEWQRLWLSLMRRPWSALAIVPASSGGPADFTTRIAVTLAHVGMVHLGAPVQIADATDLTLGNVRLFLEEIAHCRALGDRILLSLAPIGENPVTETLVTHTDCSLLCVLFEQMSSRQASETVNKIGKAHFIGSTIFQPRDLAPVTAPKRQ